MQIQKISFSILLCFLFLFSSCEKDLVTEETWYFYDQTKCADVWDNYLINVTTYEGYIEYHFSTTTEVIIDEIQIVDDGAEEQDCEACNCTTGTRIRVKADSQFQSIMEEEGFILE
jgi:hypothetical protein